MAYDEGTAERVRALLSRHQGVVEKKLMGTLAFMVSGAMCCSVGPEGLLVRVDAEEREQLLASPHVTPMKLGGRTMKGFVRVASAAWRTDTALAAWLERGIAAGARKGSRRRG